VKRNLFIVCVVLALIASPVLFAAGGVEAPDKPVKLQIIDVAGNLRCSRAAIDAFRAANPKLVSDLELVTMTAPELVSKIKAQQMANNVETSLCLTGYDGMAAGKEAGVWVQTMPKYASVFQKTIDNYLPGAKAAYDLYEGYGITSVWCPGGPMFTYNPEKVPTPPKTAADLLAWAKANPNKFMYARPANSGPGRCFVMGLAFILGEAQPKEPTKWTKVWDYLKELNEYVEYYPSGTTPTYQQLAEGTRWMVASHMGWDVYTRATKIIPATSQAFVLDNTTWTNDAHFMVVPKGVSANQEKVAVALMAWLMDPNWQAYMWDQGYFYPGPAIKGVPISLAPSQSQADVKPVLRPEYDQWIAKYPNTTQLGAIAFNDMSEMWDKLVGAKIKK
jgi:putative spermidine/putrescine transport system substrate-binding protein